MKIAPIVFKNHIFFKSNNKKIDLLTQNYHFDSFEIGKTNKYSQKKLIELGLSQKEVAILIQDKYTKDEIDLILYFLAKGIDFSLALDIAIYGTSKQELLLFEKLINEGMKPKEALLTCEEYKDSIDEFVIPSELKKWRKIQNKYNSTFNKSGSEYWDIVELSKFKNSSRHFLNFAEGIIKTNSTDTNIKYVFNSFSNQTNNERFLEFGAYSSDDTVSVFRTVNSKGKIVSDERNCAFSDTEDLSYYKNTDRYFELKVQKGTYREKMGLPAITISHLIEVVNKPNGELDRVYFKKASNVLKGAWDETVYFFDDYRKNYDVISAIKKGTIKGGLSLSKTWIDDDGSVNFSQKTPVFDSVIQRNYSKNNDNWTYSFKISDIATQNPMMLLERSFEKISDNKTKTVLNGKVYECEFDNENQLVNVFYQNEIYRTVEIGARTNFNQNLWESAKKLPADLILTLDDNIDEWFETQDEDSGMMLREMSTGSDISIIAHELGHSKDVYSSMSHRISKNKQLVQLYEDELNRFEKKYTASSGKDWIIYFSQQGGTQNAFKKTSSIGLNELIAESYMLFMNYGNQCESVIDRAQFLALNFPKTIAKIATLFGLNQIKSDV